MCDNIYDFENELIEKITMKEYIEQFDPEIRSIFYNLYGNSLEAMPQELLPSKISMAHFLEGLLSINNPRSQKVILMRLGFVTGAPMTLQEVADEFGIKAERVRQIESVFVRRIHAYRRRKNLSNFIGEE